MKLADANQNPELYPDRHLNVFVAYRSHALDYNVTRAMITTLRWSRPELTAAFLREVAGVEDSTAPYHYDLQDCDYEDFDPARTKRQAVVGISVAGRLSTSLPPLDDPGQGALLLNILRAPAFLNAPPAHKLEQIRKALGRPDLDMDDLAVLYHTLEELEEGCVPDGWVLSGADGGTCVLVEAKLTQLLDLSQLQRYADVYFDRHYEAEDLVLRSWTQVAEFFAGHRNDDDVRTAFLVGQLHDYLDLLGLAPFTGFKPYDFDLDAAREILPKFFKFSQTLQARAAEEGLPLGEVSFRPTGSSIGLPGMPGELCLEVRDSGIRIEYSSGQGGGDFPGRAAVDAILEASQDGKKNPLAGKELPALTVRVERLRADTADGAAWVELQTLKEDLDPEHFDDVLFELRRQHPPAESSRDAAGQYRRGRLTFTLELARDLATGPLDDLLVKALDAVRDLLKVATLLVVAEEPADAEPASAET